MENPCKHGDCHPNPVPFTSKESQAASLWLLGEYAAQIRMFVRAMVDVAWRLIDDNPNDDRKRLITDQRATTQKRADLAPGQVRTEQRGVDFLVG